MRASTAKSPRKGLLILWFALGVLGQAAHPARAADDGLVRNNFGSVGLIDMPNARMAPDGEFSAGASFFKSTQHYNFDFQILPWLESSFRYSGLQHLNPLFPVYYDRSFALKIRLVNETGVTPAIAVGVNDLIGSGIYGGEYVAASKQFGAIDATIGMGWGRLGSTGLFRNPLGAISNSFDTRPIITVAGGTDFNSLFRGGTAALFGGATWHTPIPGLTMVAEYSSDRYILETAQGSFRPRNQFNIGASYRVNDSIVLGLNWLYGTTVGASIAFELDPSRPQYPAKIEPAPLEIAVRTSNEQQQALTKMARQSQAKSESPHALPHPQTSGLVDALWQSGFDFSDIRTKGNYLYLSGKRVVNQNTCRKIAQLASQHQFNGVILARDIGDRNPIRCAPVVSTDRNNSQSLASVRGTDYGKAWNVQIIDAATGGQTDTVTAMRAIRKKAEKQQIGIAAIDFSGSAALVYYTNSHYFSEQDVLDRLTRILMADAPTDIEKFRLISTVDGQPQREFELLRAPLERNSVQADKLDVSDTMVATYPSLQNPVLAATNRTSFPRFSWGISPFLRQELFDPTNPFAVQLGVGVDAKLEFLRGWTLNGEVETSIYDDFNTARDSGSDLPHVRSDFLKYFAQGKTGIGELHTDYGFRLTPNIFATIKAGYLESMFAGGGGEILWQPDGQRWALGADVYEVWQRDFNRLFGLQNYRVTTGHVSFYYASPWHGLNFMVSAGQYLAGDRGLTLQITRRFSTGIEIGAFATKTNVSADRFGEGSFDKGIIIRIPLGWALPIETQSTFGVDIRPVQRDGGQRLQGDATLYAETLRNSDAELARYTDGSAGP